MALGAAFFNKGENCIAAGRIFVEETIYDEFLKRAAVEVSKDLGRTKKAVFTGCRVFR